MPPEDPYARQRRYLAERSNVRIRDELVDRLRKLWPDRPLVQCVEAAIEQYLRQHEAPNTQLDRAIDDAMAKHGVRDD